jgi:tetratricopeptide (TPR) repeat protein
VGTYIRNKAWATEITLWTDAMKKAPGQARPLFMVAKYRYHLKGNLNKAYELYETAFHSKASSPNRSKAMCLNGMAGIAFKKQDYEKAIQLSHEALKYNQNSGEAKFNIVLTLLKDNQFNTAMEVLEKFYGQTPHIETYANFKGLILLGQNKPLEAILIFDAFLEKDPYHWRSILNKGVALSRSGHLREAEPYLLKAVEMNPSDINSIFFLLENSIKTDDKSKINRDIEYLTTKFDIHYIEAGLNGKFRSGFTPNLDKNILEPVILQKFDPLENSIPLKNDSVE